MLLAVLSGFLAAAAAPVLHRLVRGALGWLLALVPLSLTVYFARFVPRVAAGETVHVVYEWVPSLGIEASFLLDGLSLLFALLISFAGVLVVIYAGGYLHGHRDLGRFYAALLSFMAAMLGVVLSSNLVSLFIFWELTSLTSYFLIGFYHDKAKSRAAALQALLVTGSGGLALLAGFLLLGLAGGSLEVAELLSGGSVAGHPLYGAILALILAGAFTKSAQTPFHFWLPAAMEAPAPVSAYLHAATMVKAGVYLLARLSPVLGGTDAWYGWVSGVGLVTMVAGAYVALKQTHLKRILAYSTVSSLGILVFLLGIGTEAAVRAAMAYLLAHSLFKGALFLAAGAIDHGTGEADVTRLAGLMKPMRWTIAAALLAAVSMAGAPPALGFIAKEGLLEAVRHAPQNALLFTAAAVVAAALTVTAALLVSLRPASGPLAPTPHEPHEAGAAMLLGPAVLALGGLAVGLAPGLAGRPLLGPAASAVLGRNIEADLHLWHGFTFELLLSALALGAGAVLYQRWTAFRSRSEALDPTSRWGLPQAYELGLASLNWIARAQTLLLQNGKLRLYLLTILTTMGVFVGLSLIRQRITFAVEVADVYFHEACLAALTVAAAIVTVRSTGRLAAIAAMGVAGFAIAVLFLLFGAPDLAMTQFVIETLTVILFVLAFYRLPRFESITGTPARVRDAVFSIAVGGMVTALLLVATQFQFHPAISDYFGRASWLQAHGRNVVNVILVDFRAIDTFGEITVLAIAGIGVYGLLRLRWGKGEGR